MKLSQSHDPDRKFNRLTWVDSSFFYLLFMRLSQSHNSNHEFDRSTQIELASRSSIFFTKKNISNTIILFFFVYFFKNYPIQHLTPNIY
jgi:hypothetical protein